MQKECNVVMLATDRAENAVILHNPSKILLL